MVDVFRGTVVDGEQKTLPAHHGASEPTGRERSTVERDTSGDSDPVVVGNDRQHSEPSGSTGVDGERASETLGPRVDRSPPPASASECDPSADYRPPPEPSEPESDEEDPGSEGDSMGVPSSSIDPEVVDALDRIERHLDEVRRLGARHADHVNELHAENQRLRAGELQTATTLFARDVIALYDDVIRLSSTGSSATDDLNIVADRILAMLDRWGYESYSPGLGDQFDTTVHSGVGRIPSTDRISETIALVRRCGFRAVGGRLLRPADVEVYTRPPEPQATRTPTPLTDPSAENSEQLDEQ